MSQSVSTAASAASAAIGATPNLTPLVAILQQLVQSSYSNGQQLQAIAKALEAEVTGFVTFTSDATVTASGTSQATATALTAQDNVVTTCPSGAGIAVPSSALGAWVTIINNTATACLVYPPTGAAWNALEVNAGYSLAAGTSARFKLFTQTQGYTG